MIKRKKLLLGSIFLAFVFIFSSIALLFLHTSTVDAEENQISGWEDECEKYTASLKLYNDLDKTIEEYEDYIDSHFSPGVKTKNPSLFDEWILQIIPKTLFDNPGQYSYCGKTYGFFFDYEEENAQYFLYLYKFCTKQVFYLMDSMKAR